MRKSLFIVICVLVFIFGSIFLPVSEAKVLKLGNKVAEGDFPLYTFSSGIIAYTEADYIDYIPLIFDGNESTGINKNFNNSDRIMYIELIFPSPLNISNITIKPSFSGGSSEFQFYVSSSSGRLGVEGKISGERFYHINCSLKGISIDIFDINYGKVNVTETGHFCFNDIIINYTSSPAVDDKKQKIPTPKIFDIGNIISESDKLSGGNQQWYYFDTKVMVETHPTLKKYVPLIFDGNLSTGINKNFGPDHSYINIELVFPDKFYVNNITVRPNFNGKATKCGFWIFIGNDNSHFCLPFTINKTFQINSLIDGLNIQLQTNGTNQVYFNDVIINYTPSLSDSNSFQSSNEIQNQLNLLNSNIISINNEITTLKKNINKIKEDIKKIQTNNISANNNVTLQNQIDNLTKEVNSLKENLSKIKNSIPTEYNDSKLLGSIFNLEIKNINLTQKINNLTVKINNLTTELDKLSEQVKNLESSGVSGADGQEEKDLGYFQNGGLVVLIVIIIVLLLVILKLSLYILKKRELSQENRVTENEVYSKVMHDIMFDFKPERKKIGSDEIKTKLDMKFQNGKMSDETYDDMKKIISTHEKIQSKKKG